MPRPARVALAAAVTVAAGGGAYLLGAATSPSAPSQPAPHHRPAPVPQAEPAPTGALSPEATGVAWLQAMHQRSHHDPGPLAWAERAQRYVTGEAAAELDALQTNRGSGTDWAGFTAEQCRSEVHHAGAVVPPEAPATAEIVYVQVSGTISTHCQDGPRGEQPVAATIELTRTGPGWQVSRQLF